MAAPCSGDEAESKGNKKTPLMRRGSEEGGGGGGEHSEGLLDVDRPKNCAIMEVDDRQPPSAVTDDVAVGHTGWKKSKKKDRKKIFYVPIGKKKNMEKPLINNPRGYKNFGGEAKLHRQLTFWLFMQRLAVTKNTVYGIAEQNPPEEVKVSAPNRRVDFKALVKANGWPKRMTSKVEFFYWCLVFCCCMLMITTLSVDADKLYVSKVVEIDSLDLPVGNGNDDKCKNSTYIQIETGPDCTFYICYLRLRMKPQLQVNYASANNVVREKCNENMAHHVVNNSVTMEWHGISVQKDQNLNSLHVRMTFAKKELLMVSPGAFLRVHFGTHDSPLFTKFTDLNNEPLDVTANEDLKSAKKLKYPENFRMGPHAMQRDDANWLIPMDMGFYNRTRMAYFVATCENMATDQEPSMKFVIGENESKIEWMPPTDQPMTDKPATDSTGPTDEPNTDKSAGITKSTTKRTTTTMKPAEKICTTQKFRVKPAVIRDRFADLDSQCHDLKHPENCDELIDYAVRIGCISCEKGITAEKQNYFLEALKIWVSKNVTKWDDLKGWVGTDLCALSDPSNRRCITKISSGTEQTIYTLEPGGFRYVTVPEDWIREGVTMLVHDCGFGKFASAARKENLDSLGQPVVRLGTGDFTFLEKCKFGVQMIRDDNYMYGDDPGKVLEDNYIWFGTIKDKNNPNVPPKDYKLSPEEMQAHKFKYGLSDPLRENSLIGDTIDKYTRVKKWGRYIAPPDEMYGKHEKHTIDVYLEIIKELDGQERMTREELKTANMHASVYQMEIICGDIIHKSTRIHAIQEVSYNIGDVAHKNTFILQMIRYVLDDDMYEPPFFSLTAKYRKICVKNEECLQKIHLYKYIVSEDGK